MQEQPLPHCPTDRLCRITRIAEGKARQRLMEMGLLPGESIKIAHRLPLGGPLTVELETGLLVLRRAEAETVWVEA